MECVNDDYVKHDLSVAAVLSDTIQICGNIFLPSGGHPDNIKIAMPKKRSVLRS